MRFAFPESWFCTYPNLAYGVLQKRLIYFLCFSLDDFLWWSASFDEISDFPVNRFLVDLLMVSLDILISDDLVLSEFDLLMPLACFLGYYFGFLILFFDDGVGTLTPSFTFFLINILS